MGCKISKEKVEKTTPGGQGDISDILRDINRSFYTVLLLGFPGAGKSTLLKQLRILHTDGYPIAERQSFRKRIFSNTIQSMRTMLEHMESLSFTSDDPTMASYIHTILEQPAEIQDDMIPPAVHAALVALLEHDVIQESLTRSIRHTSSDPSVYFLDNLKRIAGPGYVPNHHDILRSYTTTTDVTEVIIFPRSTPYRMIEVPYSQSIQDTIGSYEDVAAVIFYVDLSSYDQLPSSDDANTSLQDALFLFGTTLNSPTLVAGTKVFLFLNKVDIFKEKLIVSPLDRQFPEYNGGDDFQTALRYIVDQFANLNTDQSRQLYTYFTCSVDTTQIRFVMAAFHDTIPPQCTLGSVLL